MTVKMIMLSVVRFLRWFLIAALLLVAGFSTWQYVAGYSWRSCIESIRGFATGADSDRLVSDFNKLLMNSEDRDREAVVAAVDDLRSFLVGQDIDYFLDDLYSWSSKGAMLWYMVKDVRFKELDLPNQWFGSFVLKVVPYSGGSSLDSFIEKKFDRHLGSREEIRKKMAILLDGLGSRLAANNENLALGIGELVEAELAAEKSFLRFGDGDGFHDQACLLSREIVQQTAILQLAVEAGCLALDIVVAPTVAAILIESLVTVGLLQAATDVAVGAAGFGVGLLAAVIVDQAANKISQGHLRPKIAEALEQRNRAVMAAFIDTLESQLRRYHKARRGQLEKVLRSHS